MEQEFVLLIIAALPSEAGLPNEYISYRIHSLKLGIVTLTRMTFNRITLSTVSINKTALQNETQQSETAE
jgi:hypothetical protein